MMIKLEESRIKKIGKIVHYSDLGNAIVVDPPKLPKINSDVVNEKMEHIGSVAEIFGPVKKPYVSVKIKRQLIDKIVIGTVLYTIDRKPTNVRQKKRYSQKSKHKR